jgi:undecaprenyl-diphosphatase
VSSATLVKGFPITLLQAIFLGVVQGLTEFLPVSSSAHLVFFQSVFGLKEPRVFFDVVLHLGTLLTVIVYFRNEIVRIARDLPTGLRGGPSVPRSTRLLIWIILASIPTGLMGFLLKGWFESLFSEPKAVGAMLLITGSALWLTRYWEREGRTLERMRWADALVIGIAQGVAIIPGISRSGATISSGLFLGLERELSGRFSFLLSIPAILGATALEFRKIESPTEVWVYLGGAAAAFIVGLMALRVLMKLIRRGKLFTFAYYCWAMGMVMMIAAG